MFGALNKRRPSGLILMLGLFVLLASTRTFAQGPRSVAPIAEKLLEAVVNISTTQTLKGPKGIPLPKVPKGSPFEEFFQDFFKNNRTPGAPRKVSSLGSGFVIDASGLIVTNNHVIAGAERITVTLSNGESFPAKQVGGDALTDSGSYPH